jgi:hypothetical protein
MFEKFCISIPRQPKRAANAVEQHSPFAWLRTHAIRAVHLTLEHFQLRDDRWAIVALFGKGGHIRSVPVPNWARALSIAEQRSTDCRGTLISLRD